MKILIFYILVMFLVITCNSYSKPVVTIPGPKYCIIDLEYDQEDTEECDCKTCNYD
jgi:hypothetical protein